MTKIITRYFDDVQQAKATEHKLLSQRFPRGIVKVYTDAKDLAGVLEAAHVESATAKAYQAKVKKSGAVMLIKAGFKPLGVAQIARETMAKMGAAPTDGLIEEVFVKDKPGENPSIMADHPLFMTRAKDPNSTNYYMADWPIPLISRRVPSSEMLIPRHGRMANWPIALLSNHKPRDEFLFPRHARMANLIFPLTIRRTPADRFAFPRHARMANFPIPLISKRKPNTNSLIPRHARMANWPFPHLINGKTGTNSLMPGGPRMANFPMNLLSKREPFTGSIFPRHARMANLILPLISKRKPFTGSMFSKHARMADMFLPLVSKRGSAFSFSKMLGMPTLSREISDTSV